jgi:hypothetical protein
VAYCCGTRRWPGKFARRRPPVKFRQRLKINVNLAKNIDTLDQTQFPSPPKCDIAFTPVAANGFCGSESTRRRPIV